MNLRQIRKPVFLMNVPLSLSATIANNVWMDNLSLQERIVDIDLAIKQHCALVSFVSRYAIVYQLPCTQGLQDQTYVANLGIALPHTPKATLVVANFRSEPRCGESAAGSQFFAQFQDFEVHQAPRFFEGEADLKHIRDNIYVGAFGLRTSRGALDWFERIFDMKILPFEMTDPRLYHLDCCILPITPTDVAVCTSQASPEFLRELEKFAVIHDVSLQASLGGANNSIILGEYIMCSASLWEMSRSDRLYDIERAKVESMNALCAKLGKKPAYFNLSEFNKSGAALSCMMMHLTRQNFADSASQTAHLDGPYAMLDVDGKATLLT